MVLRDTFLDLNLWQNMCIVRNMLNWGHAQICTCKFCLTQKNPLWKTLWTIWKSHKTWDVHPTMPFPAHLMATWALQFYGTRHQNICPKQLKIQSKPPHVTFMGRGEGFVCIPDTHVPLPCWSLQRPPHLFAGLQEEILTWAASRISAHVWKCEMNGRGRI